MGDKWRIDDRFKWFCRDEKFNMIFLEVIYSLIFWNKVYKNKRNMHV